MKNINKKLDNLLRKQGYLKIPFEMNKSRHIVFDIILNDLPAKFLIDSGASGTILTLESINKFSLNVKETSEKSTGAASSNISMQNSINNSLTFKHFKIDNLDLYIMDLSHVNESLKEMNDEPIDGILGADILSNYNCVLDYKGYNFYISTK